MRPATNTKAAVSGPTALTGENESQSERRERDQNVAAGAVRSRKDLFAQSAGRPDGVQRKMKKLPREVGGNDHAEINSQCSQPPRDVDGSYGF
jgi:hypothetical protein